MHGLLESWELPLRAERRNKLKAINEQFARVVHVRKSRATNSGKLIPRVAMSGLCPPRD